MNKEVSTIIKAVNDAISSGHFEIEKTNSLSTTISVDLVQVRLMEDHLDGGYQIWSIEIPYEATLSDAQDIEVGAKIDKHNKKLDRKEIERKIKELEAKLKGLDQ